MVARRYDVNANQVFKWRKQYRDGLLTEGGTMLPVVIEGTVTVAAAAPEPAASIELQLPGGHVSLHGAVDADTLRHVVALLSRR
jgi:transposase